MSLRIKNWTKYQQYRDRRPQWIKLHRELLDNCKFFSLTDGAARLLICAWLIACEDSTMEGVLPDPSVIAWRLRLSEGTAVGLLDELIAADFVVDDNPVQNRTEPYGTVQTDGAPRTESDKSVPREEKRREREETELEKRQIAQRPPLGSRSRASTDPDFDAFWEAYPRKIAKRDALKAWRATAAERSPIDDVLAAVKAARLSEQWRRDGGQYVPYPATWLRAGRWADSVEVEGALPPESRKEREFRNDMDSLRKWGERRANRQGDHDGAGQLPAGICGLLGDRGTGGDVV